MEEQSEAANEGSRVASTPLRQDWNERRKIKWLLVGEIPREDDQKPTITQEAFAFSHLTAFSGPK